MLKLALIEARLGLMIALRHAPTEYQAIYDMLTDMSNTAKVADKRAKMGVV